VEDWLKGDGADPNQRDYTGRAPLHLAVTSSTPDIVNCLVKNGARLVARLVDGRTALHLAALRGDSKIVKIIMEKSEANEAEEELKAMRRKDAKAAAKVSQQPTEENGKSDTDKNSSHDSDEDPEFINAEDDSEDGMQSVATGSFVKVGRDKDSGNGDALPRDEDEDEPDFYDVNVVSWDTPCSPLHLAIVNGHTEVVKMLCGDFGADVLLPVKLLSDYDKSPRAAILTLVLALSLPLEQAKVMAQTLLDLGATSNQADLKGITAFHYYVNNGPNTTQILLENDTAAARAALKHIVVTGNRYSPGTASSSLLTAIQNRDAITALKLLDSGAAAQIEFASWIKSAKISFENNYGFRDDPEDNMKLFKKSVDQPICVAVEAEQPSVALEILERGADPNTLTKTGAEVVQDEYQRRYRPGESFRDQVQETR
jgi:ankyrin repeat protein